MNSVQLMGRLTRDPELSYVQGSGNAMTRFTVAVDKQLSSEKKKEMEAQNKPTADFINCQAWGKLAETINSYTAKGKRIIVQGRIQTGSYENKEGFRVYTTDIIANSVDFIDWKDQEEQQQQEQDDFFGDDFSPVNDERIPF